MPNRAWRCVLGVALVAVAGLATHGSAAPSYTVAGVVVDKEGYPVAQAWMDLRDEHGLAPPGKASRTRTTKEDGKFEFVALDAGRYRLRVVAPYCAWHRTPLVSAGTTDVRVVMESERTLRGRVADPDGKPVAGALVTMRIPEAAIAPNFETGDDGRFTLKHLTASPGELVVSVPGRGAGKRAKWVARKEGVRASDEPSDVTLGGGLVLAGVVVAETGLPAQCGVLAIPFERAVNSAVLKDHWPSAWTAEDGSFRIEGLEKGAYRLARWYGDAAADLARGDAQRRLGGGDEVEAGRTDVKLTLVEPQ